MEFRYKGFLGLPRLTGMGLFSEPVDKYSKIEGTIVEAINRYDIDANNPTEEDLRDITLAVIDEHGPDKAPQVKNEIAGCMFSATSGDWSYAFTEATTGEQSVYEEITLRAVYCFGISGVQL